MLDTRIGEGARRAYFEHCKLSLGTCGRSHATRCIHEHACLRCSLLRPDPPNDRDWSISATTCTPASSKPATKAARRVDCLQIGLTGAREKLAQLDQIAAKKDQHTARDAPSVNGHAGFRLESQVLLDPKAQAA